MEGGTWEPRTGPYRYGFSSRYTLVAHRCWTQTDRGVWTAASSAKRCTSWCVCERAQTYTASKMRSFYPRLASLGPRIAHDGMLRILPLRIRSTVCVPIRSSFLRRTSIPESTSPTPTLRASPSTAASATPAASWARTGSPKLSGGR